jgi:hypothetical protein
LKGSVERRGDRVQRLIDEEPMCERAAPSTKATGMSAMLAGTSL